MPTALAEAARLEGASTWQVIWNIYVPISAPGIAATVILNSIKIWNELSIALALTFDNAQTVTLAVAGFRGYASIDWGGDVCGRDYCDHPHGSFLPSPRNGTSFKASALVP